MIREESLSTFRSYVADAFKAGMKEFPHYTLHGAEHLAELDRLALLVGESIPKLSPDRINLLRIALIMHDFAMVAVPDPAREQELREQMEPGRSFADIVRKTHQDEIERSLTTPERTAFLTSTFADAEPYILDDALTIARHHRFNPLAGAPDHLQDLCALMRLIDELDIGPRRAPIPTYEALRSRMDPVSRFHWLKHICTRAVDRDTTFTIEIPSENRRVLKFWIAVKATSDTWSPLQDQILAKLRRCIEDEGVNRILRDKLGVEAVMERGREDLCGQALFLHPLVCDDLESLPDLVLRPPHAVAPDEVGTDRSEPPQLVAADKAVEVAKSRQVRGVQTISPASPSSPDREFRIIAIPPETLPEALCRSGRLSVIGNKYVAPPEEHIGGAADAPSRIYVGPADCGKTRAAAEWIARLTVGRPGSWVVLRTDMGTIPENIDRIVLDTHLYTTQGHQLPQKAILFLDDLPANLPPPGTRHSPTDAVRGLFAWLHAQPYFRELRVVGTIRAEDMHSRPDWPDVLPALGHELELLSLRPHTDAQYRELWEGMANGTIFISETSGPKRFSLDLEEGFVDAVAQRPADPEAVAIFVHDSARKQKTRVTTADAAGFSDSAVQTWLHETWPGIETTYGVPARVFFTLARFIEAGLRPAGGFKGILPPLWDYHQAFGPDLCHENGHSGEEYTSVIDRIGRDGHAIGRPDHWIRPRWDFVLQSERLQPVELDLPDFDWFADRSSRLTPAARRGLALHLSAADVHLSSSSKLDAAWFLGWAEGKALRANLEKNEVVAREHNSQAVQAYHDTIDAEPNSDGIWIAIGVGLGIQAAIASDDAQRRALITTATQVLRNAVERNPKNDEALVILGIALSDCAAAETDDARRVQLRREEIDAYRKCIDANPKNDTAWTALGISLGEMADAETDDARRLKLRGDVIDAYRKAIDANPKNDTAWNNLGSRLRVMADAETDDARRLELRREEIDAYRKAVGANLKNDTAWSNIGIRLGRMADAETDEARRLELRREEIDAYRKAVDANPKNDTAWSNLGINLGQMADSESDDAHRLELRSEEIDAYRKAVEANPKNDTGWDNLSAGLVDLFHDTGDSSVISEALVAAKQAVSRGAGHYNLACALVLNGEVNEALDELEGSLNRNEIERSHVAEDDDWKGLHENPRFRTLVGL